jgi:hypothetical protein
MSSPDTSPYGTYMELNGNVYIGEPIRTDAGAAEHRQVACAECAAVLPPRQGNIRGVANKRAHVLSVWR